jgi:hypothetical protein
MKSQNLFGITALSCTLLFGSGAAMAARNCISAYITGYVTEDIVITYPNCVVENATVKGNITATDANLAISVQNSNVSGKILIEGAVMATVQGSTAKKITLKSNEVAQVVGSTTTNDIIVNKNALAAVSKAQAGGNLSCVNNTKLMTGSRNSADGKKDCLGDNPPKQ